MGRNKAHRSVEIALLKLESWKRGSREVTIKLLFYDFDVDDKL